MQRLISAVTALSLAVYGSPPFVTPVSAQTTQTTLSSVIDGQTVICLPDKAAICADGAICVVAKTQDACDKRALKEVKTRAAEVASSVMAAAAATGGPQPVPVDIADTVVLCLPDKALDCAEGAICIRVKDAANCQKAAQQKIKSLKAEAGTTTAAAEPAPQPATEPAPEPATQLATEPAPAPADQATTAPADQATTDQTTTDQATADAATGDQATGNAVTADQTAPQPAPEPAPAAPAQAEQPAAPPAGFAPKTVTLQGQTLVCLPQDKSVACPEGALCVRAKSPERCDAAAQRKLDQIAAAKAEDQKAIDAAKAAAAAAAASGKPLIDAPVVAPEAQASLDAAVAATASADDTTAAEPPPVAAAAAADTGKTPDAQTPAPDAVVKEETVTAADTRASSQDFAAAPAVTADGKKKTGLSDLEKVGLVALGALAIGTMLKGNNEVVQNSGDRVVVKDPAGNYQVYKDDDALLRQPGSNVRTETFQDGSTRTTVMRPDGTRVVTIRDATGRVLRRSAYDAQGLEIVLIDDTIPEQRVDVTKLPPPPPPLQMGQNDDELAARLAQIEAQKAGRTFSLRQIRTIPEVKALAPALPVPLVTFESGSAAIRPDQAEELAALGDLVRKLIKRNPNSVFLVEGHTDATGTAAMNLTLSDRRAESVAKALTEYFGVAPENLVVQGYGESELLIDTQVSERANRRVVVRDITALLRQKQG